MRREASSHFGGDHRFWIWFGGIWLIAGLLFVLSSVVAMLLAEGTVGEPILWGFLLAGAALSAVGLYLARRAARARSRDERLDRTRFELAATVLEVRRSPFDVNRQPRWHVIYRFEHSPGRVFQGRSRGLPGPAVADIRPGDSVMVKVGPRDPSQSLYVGGRNGR